MALFDIKRHEANEARKVHLRKYARLTLEAQECLLSIIAQDAKRTDFFQTCITCSNFEADEVCRLVGKRPPAKVIADGCEKYSNSFDDDIPF